MSTSEKCSAGPRESRCMDIVRDGLNTPFGERKKRKKKGRAAERVSILNYNGG